MCFGDRSSRKGYLSCLTIVLSMIVANSAQAEDSAARLSQGAEPITEAAAAPADAVARSAPQQGAKLGGAPNANVFNFATADSEPQARGAGGSIVRMVQGLGLCLAVFLVGVKIYKRYSKHPPIARSRRMKILERLPLAGKNALILAEVDGRSILVTLGEQISVMQLDEQLSVPDMPAGNSKFDESLDTLCSGDERLV